MARSRGRRVALWAGAAGIAALVVAGLALRDAIREAWHLERLRGGDDASKRQAIDALGGLRSRRANAPLLELVDGNEALGPASAAALARIGEERAVLEAAALLRRKETLFRRRTLSELLQLPPGTEGAFDLLLGIALSGRGDAEEAVLWQAVEGLPRHGGDPVPRLIEALGDPDPEVVRRAVRIFQYLGPRGEAAVPALVRLLSRNDAKWEASAALGYVGKAAVPALLSALEGFDPEVRWGAARALGWMKAQAAGAVPALARALGDPSRRVRGQVVEALATIGPAAGDAVPALLRALEDPRFREPDPGQHVWITVSGDPDCEDPRVAVAWALGEIGALPEDVVPALVRALAVDNDCLRARAAAALGAFGRAASEAVPALAAIVLEGARQPRREIPGRSSDPTRVALDAIEKIGVASDEVRRAEVRRAIAACLASEDAGLRAAAARVGSTFDSGDPSLAAALLSSIRRSTDRGDGCPPEAEPLANLGARVVPTLIETLSDPSAAARRGAACALGRMGTVAKDAVPALVKRFPEEGDPRARRALVSALASIAPGTEEALAALAAGLEDADAGVRDAAVSAVRSAGRPAARVVPILLRMLADSGAPARWGVPGALASIAGRTDETVAALLQALDDGDPFVRAGATGALRTLRVSGDRVLGALRRVLLETGPAAGQREYWRARTAAAASLLEMGAPGRAAVLEALAHQSEDVRAMAARALGGLSGPDEEVARALTKALGDPSSRVAGEARTALRDLERR